jgi:hypothetical protein
MDYVDGEMGFVEIWIPKAPYSKLGLIITMVS